MTTHSGNRYLSLSEMTDNANYIYSYLSAEGWTKESICGMLGNMQRESTINPGIWQNLDEGNTSLGYGLVQWTPSTNYTDWADANGLEWGAMDSNLKRILYELENGLQWITKDEYPMSFEAFTQSTDSVEYLAEVFLQNYERAGVEVLDERKANARYWYEHVEGGSTSSFTPRLDSDGMEGSFYWYSKNPFYLVGYGLPNCTTYAWGRFWEIYDEIGDGSNPPTLSTRDAENWFDYTSDGYERGQTPKLGAVIVWGKGVIGDDSDGAGHVGIVEEIASNGDITVSQSAYGGTYFYTNVKTADSGYELSGYNFLGFIYNPFVPSSGGESGDSTIIPILNKKKKKFSFVLYNKRRAIHG